MKIIAHRGASGYAPENTLASFKKALQLRADMVEFDVHTLPSDEVLLMHDHRVNRTTNGKGYILGQSFAELRGLDAGEGETIPILEEVLDFIDRRVRVNIEFKGRRARWQSQVSLPKFAPRMATFRFSNLLLQSSRAETI